MDFKYFELWSQKEMCKRFHRSSSTIHRWVCHPDFPKPVPRDQKLWLAEDVVKWIMGK